MLSCLSRLGFFMKVDGPVDILGMLRTVLQEQTSLLACVNGHARKIADFRALVLIETVWLFQGAVPRSL